MRRIGTLLTLVAFAYLLASVGLWGWRRDAPFQFLYPDAQLEVPAAWVPANVQQGAHSGWPNFLVPLNSIPEPLRASFIRRGNMFPGGPLSITIGHHPADEVTRDFSQHKRDHQWVDVVGPNGLRGIERVGGEHGIVKQMMFDLGQASGPIARCTSFTDRTVCSVDAPLMGTCITACTKIQIYVPYEELPQWSQIAEEYREVLQQVAVKKK